MTARRQPRTTHATLPAFIEATVDAKGASPVFFRFDPANPTHVRMLLHQHTKVLHRWLVEAAGILHHAGCPEVITAIAAQIDALERAAAKIGGAS